MLQTMSPVQLLTPNSAGMSPSGHLLRYAAGRDTPSTPLSQNGAAHGSEVHHSSCCGCLLSEKLCQEFFTQVMHYCRSIATIMIAAL